MVENLARQRRDERTKAILDAQAVKRVRVLPANDAIRAAIKHPTGGIAFPASGSVDWPLDQFTKRRIRDGDVTIEEAPADTNTASPAEEPTQIASSSDTAAVAGRGQTAARQPQEQPQPEQALKQPE